MVSRKQRVTNGHRAGVCGLVIAGCGFVEACRVMGVPYYLVKETLGGRWDGRHWCHKPNRRWQGEELAAAREAFSDLSMTTAQVAVLFGVKRDTLWKLAKQHGWPKRRRGGKGKPLPVPFAKMDPEQANRYRKLQRVIGSDAARKAVFG